MAGNDNSFERQMLDFYNEEIFDYLHDKYDDIDNVSYEMSVVYLSIYLDLVIKKYNVSKDFLDREKNKIQIELYNQLEKDRINGK